MMVADSKRKAEGRNYAYNQLKDFHCKRCYGMASVIDNRIRVNHRPDCSIQKRLERMWRFQEIVRYYRSKMY